MTAPRLLVADDEPLLRAIERVRARLALPPPDLTQLVLRLRDESKALDWLQATVGNTIHFIDLTDVVYFCADAKYTRVVTESLEADIRMSLTELADSLDPATFWQIHRGYIVAVRRIASAARGGRRLAASSAQPQGPASGQPAFPAFVSGDVEGARLQ
jgi:DNA-binding LytR/AlgR family response regulator